MKAPSGDVTVLLRAWSKGDEAAFSRLVEQVYPELRRMARRYMRNEHPTHTLQSTALVHEAYLRMVDAAEVNWRDRAQFFAMAAQMMRRILVDAARARDANKRGGGLIKVPMDESATLSDPPDRTVLDVDEALTAFSKIAPRQAKVVELHYFGGLAEEEIVEVLGISLRTIRRDWDFAKAWLLRELDQSSEGAPTSRT